MSDASTPRIAPGRRRDVGLVNWAVCVVLGRAAGTGPPNVFTTLARHRGLFRGWLHFAGKMMPGGRLSRRETETVILRVAHTRGCEYEWQHHRALGKKAGVTDDEIERLQAAELDGWTGRLAAILDAADELLRTDDLSDESWALLKRHLDEREAIELLLLVGHYRMLATALTTLRVPLDDHS